MRMPAIFALAAVSLSACATNQPAPLVERGYDRGALAVAAIERGDWATAERLLTQGRGDPNDPARLINLGRVYIATDRPGEALTVWRLALASDRHFEVETREGTVISTADLARHALARHDPGTRTATR
jgi:hypothetical protein